MTDEVFDKIIERVVNENLKIELFKLHLNGEPFTDPQLFKRVKKLKGLFPHSHVIFTTNFALANKERIDEMVKSGLDQVTISINSLDPDEYKRLMGLDLEKTLENISSLIENNNGMGELKIILSIVLRPDNIEMYHRIEKKFPEIQIRTIKIGKWIGHESLFDSLGVSKEIDKAKVREVCNEPFHKVVIMSNGDYGLCAFDPEGIVGLNVMTTSITDAFNSEVYRHVREHQMKFGRTNKECIGCSATF